MTPSSTSRPKTDREFQLQNLYHISAHANYAPVFRDNPKYPIKSGCVRIAHGDLMAYRWILRRHKNIRGDLMDAKNIFWDNQDAEIIAQYPSMEALVDDGWRLD